MLNFNLKKQSGAATFLITTLLLVSATMIALFAADYGIKQQKMNTNATRTQQAFEASEAGLEFGINYLKQNSATILANPVGGYIPNYTNASTTNVSLTNGSTFSITFTNPIANNYNILQISSVGTSNDGTATKTITQKVSFGSLMAAPPARALTAKGSVSIGGSSNIVNTTNNATIQSGDNVSFNGSGQTTISSGTGSNSSHIGSDVTQNNNTLNNISSNDLFASVFGQSMSTVKNDSVYTFSNLGNYNSVLNGLSGTSIWIDQTSGSATINSNTAIGTNANPVLLIVNGSLALSGTAIIYGFVYVIGSDTTDVNISGSAKIYGGYVTSGSLELHGNTTITYNPSVLTTLQQQVMNYYAKVPGSWKDFLILPQVWPFLFSKMVKLKIEVTFFERRAHFSRHFKMI